MRARHRSSVVLVVYLFKKREPKTRIAKTTRNTAITSRISLVIVI
jgi:hypothetical protein